MSLAREVTRATRLLREQVGCGRVLYGDLEHGVTLLVEAVSSPEQVEFGVGRWELGEWWPAGVRAAFERGEAIVIDDVEREERIPPETRAAYADWGVAAFLNVPVVEGGALVAVAVVQDGERRAWTADEVALVARTAGEVREATRA